MCGQNQLKIVKKYLLRSKKMQWTPQECKGMCGQNKIKAGNNVTTRTVANMQNICQRTGQNLLLPILQHKLSTG